MLYFSIHIDYKPTHRSSLDEWFSSILNIPIDDLSIFDISRSIRQDVFLEYVLPRAEAFLNEDPLAGDYDGQLLYDFSMLDKEQPPSVMAIMKRISVCLSQLDKHEFDGQSIESIEKILLFVRG
ncbi:contact-dependent growth inhibition system immunity protein [Atlantibacter sp.]|uniref:contact-dependent growth inhibition system immunity protein n=1 Tax=Atlantibacter sp. TaxID=1903473 RepID=UPI0028AFCC0B|nr:contact-dependent growth inhibition system immunity protein [Atlantibacter sp.]